MENTHEKRGYRPAVFIVVYRKYKLPSLLRLQTTKKEEIRYLILKRKKHWKGWEFPKGGIDAGEKMMTTAKRECIEESGLKPKALKKFQVSGKYNYKRKFKDRPGYIGQTYSLFAAEVGFTKTKIDKKEHSAYLWLPFELAVKKLKHNNQKKCLRIVHTWLTPSSQ